MGSYKYIRDTWKKSSSNLTNRLVDWRKEPVTIRIARPTRLDRARSLGYRAKQGIFLVRQRLIRGGRSRETIRHGRRPKHARQRKVLDKSYQQVAEERANRKYKNCEVLNSYYLARDGRYIWYEVILVDRSSPSIKKDKQLSWVAKKNSRGRVFRGLTSSGKKTRNIK